MEQNADGVSGLVELSETEMSFVAGGDFLEAYSGAAGGLGGAVVGGLLEGGEAGTAFGPLGSLVGAAAGTVVGVASYYYFQSLNTPH